MKIYRVENSNKSGPFQGSSRAWRIAEDENRFLDLALTSYKNGGKDHPLPSKDFDTKITDIPFVYVCGCDSMKALKHWFFGKMINILGNNHFFIAVYEIDPSYVKMSNSGKQIMFNQVEAMLIEKLSVLRLR